MNTNTAATSGVIQNLLFKDLSDGLSQSNTLDDLQQYATPKLKYLLDFYAVYLSVLTQSGHAYDQYTLAVNTPIQRTTPKMRLPITQGLVSAALQLGHPVIASFSLPSGVSFLNGCIITYPIQRQLDKPLGAITFMVPNECYTETATNPPTPLSQTTTQTLSIATNHTNSPQQVIGRIASLWVPFLLRLAQHRATEFQHNALRATCQAAMQHIHRLNMANKLLTEKSAQLQAKTNTLTESNQRLKQFTHCMSHDFQAPLNRVNALTDMLQEDFSTALDAGGKTTLNHLRQSAARMTDLVTDLLEYAQSDQPDMGHTFMETAQTVDLNSLVHTVLQDLSTEIDRSKTTINAVDLPQAMGHRTQLTLVFQNLISNALKFCAPERKPSISIVATQGPEAADKGAHDPSLQPHPHPQSMIYISIQDNGIGIAPDHIQTIFEPFKRLHSHDDYPGTGLGLAICKRIVEAHGGRIFLKSQVGEGSIFTFSLPIPP